MPRTIRSATDFWIEAGAMSGPPEHRHQVEFSHDVAQFFDDMEREEEELLIRLRSGPFFVRPLRYRGTDYGQWTRIWRLGLLTSAMGGPTYSGKILHLHRIAVASNRGYELTVAGPRSALAQAWMDAARTRGTVAETGGPAGRQYGYWER